MRYLGYRENVFDYRDSEVSGDIRVPDLRGSTFVLVIPDLQDTFTHDVSRPPNSYPDTGAQISGYNSIRQVNTCSKNIVVSGYS